MTAMIYVEGGGHPGTTANVQCREEFTNLLENCGLDRSNFTVIAHGGRGDARNGFIDEIEVAAGGYYVGLLIDSECFVADAEETWTHLADCDNWTKPPNAEDDQVLLMTRSMEAWIAADRSALRDYFGENLRPDCLPESDSLEQRSPGYVRDNLESATSACPVHYAKGVVSFQILGKLNPDVLERHLPSFRRARQILNDKLT